LKIQGTITDNPLEGRRGRSTRRSEEDIPSEDYIERLKSLGPREGESYLAFRMRLASVSEGRRLLLDTAEVCGGNMELVAKTLGIRSRNVLMYLKQAGMNHEIFRRILQKRSSLRCQKNRNQKMP
jgi:hypothetical protein